MNGVAHFSEPRTKQERRERRAKLEKDREFVRAQLAELRQRVPQLQRAAVPSQGPVKQSGVSKKRPASSLADLSGDAKRQKVEAERAKRVNSIWQQCQTILKTLLKSKDAFAFSKPVNPITAKCPDYHDIIKRPMDLGTIQKKFPGKGKAGERRPELREYKTPLEFRDDVRLVWANCRTYNAVGHAVRTMGDTLSEVWEKKWALSGIEAKLHEEMRRQELEEQDLAGGSNLAQQIQALDATLHQRLKQAELQPGYQAPPEGSAMSFEQKRRLSIALGQLPGDKIAAVVRIITEDEHMRQKADSPEEVEIDIDQLSTEVLWKLERYANGVLQASKKKSSQRPAEAPKDVNEAGNGKDEKHLNGGADTPAARRSSSSSSSDSDTDRSQSDSEGEVGSKDLGASQQSGGVAPYAQQRPAGGGNDAATLVSATRPPGQPQIVKNVARIKEVNLQNANAWADLGNAKTDEPAEDAAVDAEGEDGLWDEFKSREQEEEQREKEKQVELERQQHEQHKAEEAARAEAERVKKEAEEAEKAKKAEEEARINAQKEKEMEEMQKAGKQADFAAGSLELMDSKRQGDTLTDILGLQRRDSDSDNDSDEGSPS